MRQADDIRSYAREKYVVPARGQHEKRFLIRAGDVVRDMKLVGGRTPAVCSALKSREFLRDNNLRVVHVSGPPSGQSTTVTYTYEILDGDDSRRSENDPLDAWLKLRGIAKDIFASYGGGEAYLRQERADFYGPGQDPLDRKP